MQYKYRVIEVSIEPMKRGYSEVEVLQAKINGEVASGERLVSCQILAGEKSALLTIEEALQDDYGIERL